MKYATAVLIVAAVFTVVAADTSHADVPTWAYGTDPALAAIHVSTPQTAAGEQAHLPGTDATFTRAQIGARFDPADWFPNDHPSMPDIVAHGRKPQIWACALCHYPNGKGRPENAGVSGLPEDYFIQQMKDFRNGLRHSADSRKQNTNLMIAYAKAMTDDEIQQAATYFGAIRWTQWIKVVEADTVPKTRTSVGMYLPLPGNEKEPIGGRIIEVPVNTEATEELRNPHSGFIAYVPTGSIDKGRALVTSGSNGTTPCAVCHGPDLKGLGPVPGIAGRSPSYLVRQLYDMRQGSRNGSWTQLMKPVVSRLTNEDMLNIAAYTASLTP